MAPFHSLTNVKASVHFHNDDMHFLARFKNCILIDVIHILVMYSSKYET